MHIRLNVILILTSCVSIISGQDRQPILNHQVWTFPFGWESEKRIKTTRDKIRFEPFVSYKQVGNDLLLIAPTKGRLIQKGDNFVFETESYEIIYPILVNASIIKEGKIDEGDALIKITDSSDASFFYAYVDSEETLKNCRFISGKLDWTTTASSKVYSLTPGTLSLLPNVFEDDLSSTIIVHDNDYEVAYMGITIMASPNYEDVISGSLLGMSSLNGTAYSASISLFKNVNSKTLNPTIIGIALR